MYTVNLCYIHTGEDDCFNILQELALNGISRSKGQDVHEF